MILGFLFIPFIELDLLQNLILSLKFTKKPNEDFYISSWFNPKGTGKNHHKTIYTLRM
jgi:hypothetical protein